MSKSTVEPLAVAVKVTVRPPLDPVTLSDTGGDAQWCRRVVWQRCAAPVVPVERAETGVTHNTDAPRAPTTMAIPLVRGGVREEGGGGSAPQAEKASAAKPSGEATSAPYFPQEFFVEWLSPTPQ